MSEDQTRPAPPQPQDALQMALNAAANVDLMSRQMNTLDPTAIGMRAELGGRVHAAAELGARLALISLAADLRRAASALYSLDTSLMARGRLARRDRGDRLVDGLLAAAVVLVLLMAVFR
jgi:hypothetical protein